MVGAQLVEQGPPVVVAAQLLGALAHVGRELVVGDLPPAAQLAGAVGQALGVAQQSVVPVLADGPLAVRGLGQPLEMSAEPLERRAGRLAGCRDQRTTLLVVDLGRRPRARTRHRPWPSRAPAAPGRGGPGRGRGSRCPGRAASGWLSAGRQRRPPARAPAGAGTSADRTRWRGRCRRTGRGCGASRPSRAWPPALAAPSRPGRGRSARRRPGRRRAARGSARARRPRTAHGRRWTPRTGPGAARRTRSGRACCPASGLRRAGRQPARRRAGRRAGRWWGSAWRRR